MRALWRILPCLTLLAVIGGPVAGQERDDDARKKRFEQRGAGPGAVMGSFRLLQHEDVQKELELSDAQVQKIDELGEKQREAVKEVRTREDFRKLRGTFEETQAQLTEILSEEQSKRLKQLVLQQRGPMVFFDPGVQRHLDLEPEQVADIRKALAGIRAKVVDIAKETRRDREEMRKRIGELHEETMKDIKEILTSEQEEKWRELAGEPFEGTLPPAFVGFGRPFQDRRPDRTRERRTD